MYMGKEDSALISFCDPKDAKAAMTTPEPIFGNRFIDMKYLIPLANEEVSPALSNSGTTPATNIVPLVKNRNHEILVNLPNIPEPVELRIDNGRILIDNEPSSNVVREVYILFTYYSIII